MGRAAKATFAVGIFDACDALRRALIDLVTLGYQQSQLILLRPEAVQENLSSNDTVATPVQKMASVLPCTAPNGSQCLRLGDIMIRGQECEPADIAVVRDAVNWLTPAQYSTWVDAIRFDRKILVVRIQEHRQIAPTCSILLTHGIQQVNTHEVTVPRT